ncbi:cobalamin synthesis protein P47K [Streptomyces sulfonofaciens]|uniref:Cobalamin synthesis protein P47K n=1 Tax=Streptomyces sulfonofaciens TaxID=68272 RepID=A0A919G305_9ACTN|nr:GTP-binding protein [Streptomyces sulfonofaciens]GHH76709.1 cobalamin synthesis protein P47K [Streptomyces sulfonofaciens]
MTTAPQDPGSPESPPRFVFAALGGFLGAGKTTLLTAVARLLGARGRRVAVITNDQGEELVDTAVARSSAEVVAEVTGGCFCCRFEDLTEVTTQAVARGADVVLAEAVGSCTDLQATVVRPLLREYGPLVRVAPLVTVVDPARFTALPGTGDADLAYLFDRQLAEADLIALNKADVTAPRALQAVRAALSGLHPATPVHTCSALTGAGLDALARLLAGAADPGPLPGRGSDLDVDYDRYAAAEALLAWLNHTVVVSGAPAFSSAHWARVLLTSLAARDWLVGHAKVHLEDPEGRSTQVGVTGQGRRPFVGTDGGAMARARVRINARVACEPGRLDAAVRAAVRAADLATGASSAAATAPASFRPGYPRPTHRLPGAPART